jgi:ribonuclease P protein component
MLSKINRFRGQGQVNYTLRKGARKSVSGMTVLSVVQGKSLKAAIVVSKKVSRSAVVRNKIRRKVYTALEQYKDVPKMVVIIVHTDELQERKPEEIARLLGFISET